MVLCTQLPFSNRTEWETNLFIYLTTFKHLGELLLRELSLANLKKPVNVQIGFYNAPYELPFFFKYDQNNSFPGLLRTII